MCVPGSPVKLAVSSTTLIPTVFIARSYDAFFFPALWSGLGLGLLSYNVSPWFLSTTCQCTAAHSAGCCWLLPPSCLATSLPWAYHCHMESSLLQLPISVPPTLWMNKAFLSPGLLDFHTVLGVFLGVFTFKLVVFLHMVVQWGEACLLVPPSWPELLRMEFLCALSSTTFE